MDPIKEAFAKAKQDVVELKEQISSIKQDIQEIKRTLNIQTNSDTFQADRHINPTVQQTHSPILPQYAFKAPNLHSSIGNRGVPTDRQTNQQTDNSHSTGSSELADFIETSEYLKDDLKKRFLGLTKQEREVFFMIYSLENQGFIVDYSILSEKMALTESSIRDYVLKITKKGIPIKKSKENNKKVIISIAPELKKMASLETISLFYHFQ